MNDGLELTGNVASSGNLTGYAYHPPELYLGYSARYWSNLAVSSLPFILIMALFFVLLLRIGKNNKKSASSQATYLEKTATQSIEMHIQNIKVREQQITMLEKLHQELQNLNNLIARIAEKLDK